MESFPDLGALSDQELKEMIQTLTEEEQEVSATSAASSTARSTSCAPSSSTACARQHEAGESAISGADVQQLTDILAGKSSPEPTRMTDRALSRRGPDALPRLRLRQR